jgi:hypothetical protein
MDHANLLAAYLQRNLTITSGYRPGARGAHGANGGNAFDLGHNANAPRIPRAIMEQAYNDIFNINSSMALEEIGCYHFQLQLGRGGASGFRPGLRDFRGNIVRR